jgi:hypothetical protein
MSLGIFDFHDYSIDEHGEAMNDRLVTICFNRFKTCQTNPSSHQYVLDPRIEDG